MILRSTAICAALVSAAGILLSAPVYCGQSPAGLNIKDFGAVGDGKTDDTQAIINAIEAARRQKLPVYLPKGRYRVTKPLVIEQQSLIGAEPGGWNADSAPMAMISVAHNSGPALTMRRGSSIDGMGFIYEPRTFDEYPPTILMDGQGLSISNLRLQYCDDGIITAEKAAVGRLNIENVFMVSPGGVGLFVNRTYDIPTIRNVEVWNNGNRPNITAFRFGRNDGLRASHLFAFNVNVGFELADDPEGGTWGVFTDCGTDATVTGWKVHGKSTHTVSITGGYFWDHFPTLDLDNPNLRMRIANAELQSNGAPVIRSNACRLLMVNGCSIRRAFANAGVPYADLQGVDMFTMGNCAVAGLSPIFRIGNGLEQATITGNVFESSPYKRILDDKRSKSSEIIFANNAGMEPTPATKDHAAGSAKPAPR